MRVISGQAKGRKLKSPKGLKTRPTADRVKESLFNIISDRVVGKRWLDLFAGSGNIGIEALSRGAEFLLFVDKDIEAIKAIKYNLNITKFDNAQTLKLDVFKAINILKNERDSFDVIFLDPPYNSGYIAELLSLIEQAEILADNGLIIIETSKGEEIPQSLSLLKIIRQQKYGSSMLNFYMMDERS